MMVPGCDLVSVQHAVKIEKRKDMKSVKQEYKVRVHLLNSYEAWKRLEVQA